MNLFRGDGIGRGIAIGPALVLYNEEFMTFYQRVDSDEALQEGIQRFKEAVACAKDEIRSLRTQLAQKVAEEHAEIFDAHVLLLDDQALYNGTIDLMVEKRANPDWAFHMNLTKTIRQFKHLDPFFAERAKDLEDVGRRVLRFLLAGTPLNLAGVEDPVIAVGTEFGPSNITTFDNGKILGFVTDMGGQTTHTAIIAKALNIPAILGLHNITERVSTGDFLIVDAVEGVVIVNPNTHQIEEYRKKQKDLLAQEHGYLLEIDEKIGMTKDGQQIQLMANIELAYEAADAAKVMAHGIGLYRTEFLFLTMKDTLPTEEDHFEDYCQIAQSMAQRPVTIRTLDLGGEKYGVKKLIGQHEANPVMGLRGVRLCMQRQGIFESQLRGLIRAFERFDNIRVMFPLISGLEELKDVLDFFYVTKSKLEADLRRSLPTPPIGIMIEVPSAAMIPDLLAEHVSFFSIGTNDLLQYLCAIDRANDQVAHLYNPFHPGFIRILKQVLDAGAAYGVDVCLCGEMAAKPIQACLLLQLGLKCLSMNPGSIPTIQHLLRRLDLGELNRKIPQPWGFSDTSKLRSAYRQVLESMLSPEEFRAILKAR
jgi:phosphotransferase system enzyme I (PtsI)